jgi:hypothetical protein
MACNCASPVWRRNNNSNNRNNNNNNKDSSSSSNTTKTTSTTKTSRFTFLDCRTEAARVMFLSTKWHCVVVVADVIRGQTYYGRGAVKSSDRARNTNAVVVVVARVGVE